MHIGHIDPAAEQGQRQFFRTQRQGGHTTGQRLGVALERAAQPAIAQVHIFGAGGVPDIHAAEVGPVGLGVAHALDHRHLAVIKQGAQVAQPGVQPHGAVELEHPVLGHGQHGAGLVIRVISEGDDGVQAIVAAGHFHHHQHAAGSVGFAQPPGCAHGGAPDAGQ